MIFFKRKLRKKLPYYRLTRSAKRRLNEIAAALPARDTAAVVSPPSAEKAPLAPRHLKPEPPQPLRERPAAALLRVAVCAVVCIAFVGVVAALLLLRSSVPVGPPAAQSTTPLPTPTPTPAYTMKIENAETRGGCAFFDVVLTFSDEKLRRAAFYTTELNAPEGTVNTALLIEGKKTPLDGSPIFYREDGSNCYRAAVSAKLPEPLTGGPLKAEFTISALYGMNEGGNTYAALTEPDIALNSPCAQSFVLKAAQLWSSMAGAKNGVDLLSADYDWDAATCTVVVKYPYVVEGIEPSISLVDSNGDFIPIEISNNRSSAQGFAEQNLTFGNVPYDAERLILRVLLPHFIYSEKSDSVAQLVAEFTLFPQENWFMRSGEFENEGLEECDIEQITASWKRTSSIYTDHVYLSFVSNYYDYESEASGSVLPTLQFFVDTDLAWALPLECEVTATNGERVLVPLFGERPAPGESVSGEGYRYDIENYQQNGLPHHCYTVSVTFAGNSSFWDENDAVITIKNTVSGRVVATSTVERFPSGFGGTQPPEEGSGGAGEEPALPSEAPADQPEASPSPDASEPPVSSQPIVESQPSVASAPVQPTPAPSSVPGNHHHAWKNKKEQSFP